ncbi:MAG: hypothetical protein IT381_05725 [Deltaproteobacteria bacterium]|nr:hypothetical protein [Deltaproteobacteria bacterium]
MSELVRLRRWSLGVHAVLAFAGIYFAAAPNAAGVDPLHAMVTAVAAVAFLAVAAFRATASLSHGGAVRLVLVELSVLASTLWPSTMTGIAGANVYFAWGIAELDPRAPNVARLRRAWFFGIGAHTLLITAAALVPSPHDTTLLLGAALLRLGVPPFHSWLFVLIDEAPLELSVIVVATPFSALALLSPSARLHDSLLWIGLFATMSGALATLVRSSSKRVIAAISVSLAGTMVVALSHPASSVRLGGALLGASAALALSGLLLILHGIEARLGRPMDASMSGFGHDGGQWFGRFALVFAIAIVALPGAPAFIGEDLLVDGLLSTNPMIAVLMMFAAVLVAIGIFRLVLLGFFGPKTHLRLPADALLRERTALIALTVTLGLLTVWPTMRN